MATVRTPRVPRRMTGQPLRVRLGGRYFDNVRQAVKLTRTGSR